MRRLIWWIADYAYAAAWQVRAALDRTDPRDFADGSGVPIVILPGVYETWRFMQPMIAALHARGHPVHVLDAWRHNRRPVDEAADILAAFLEDAGMADVVLVAHSKGGLAGKAAMIGRAGSRIRGMVAISTPFNGSRYARWMPVRGLRALAPTHPSIVALARHIDADSRIVSVYPRFDPHIPEGSELAGARRNVRLDTGGHFRVLADPRVIAEIAATAEQ